jgi:hypothetical protein
MLSKKLIIIYIATFSYNSQAKEPSHKKSFQEYENIVPSYQKFYSLDTQIKLGATLGVSSILANTALDQSVADYYQQNIKGIKSDELSFMAKQFGEPYFILFYPAAALTGIIFDNTYLWDWAKISTTGILTGAPMLLLLQRILGATRPNSEQKHSSYRLFSMQGAVGASGHAFMGAIPFLALASISDNKLLKGIFYLSSTFTAWSRINDEKHYLSQAILGWTLAYLAISDSYEANNFSILPHKDGVKLNFSHPI